MKYTSTRDASVSCTFEHAICSGYAPGGGLFVPESLPQLTPTQLQAFSSLTYPELTFAILRLFLSEDEITDDELMGICRRTLQGFDDPDHAVTTIPIGGMLVAELWRGPTFCFKDFGLRALIGLLSFFATKRRRPTALLVATTGDTGPAAVRAVADADNPLLTIAVHFPQGQISPFQRRQMTTCRSPRVKVVAFQGGGDDMDRPIKNLLTTPQQYVDGHQRWTGVNSYNIGRPLMQMVHYIWSYLRIAEALKLQPGDPDTPVHVVLPTGAMGNLAGGYMAKRMGVPLGKFCSGVNANDIFARTLQSGRFHRSPAMERTLSEALNIQIPYNFERILFYLIQDDGPHRHEEVKCWMETVDQTGKNDLPPEWLSLLQREFQTERISDQEMCATTREVLEDYQYWIDPHTAVAFGAAQKLGYYQKSMTELSPVILLSTASPCKFEEAVTRAVGAKAWKVYYDREFPTQGKATLEMDELEPLLFSACEGVPLEKTQDEWEAQTRSIIADLGKISAQKE